MASPGAIGSVIQVLSARLAEAMRRELPPEVAKRRKRHMFDQASGIATWARDEYQALAAKAFGPPGAGRGDERARALVDRVWNTQRLANARRLRPLLEA